jgi:hypothetical protein
MKTIKAALIVCASICMLTANVNASPCFIISDDKFVCLGLKDHLKLDT